MCLRASSVRIQVSKCKMTLFFYKIKINYISKKKNKYNRFIFFANKLTSYVNRRFLVKFVGT